MSQAVSGRPRDPLDQRDPLDILEMPKPREIDPLDVPRKPTVRMDVERVRRPRDPMDQRDSADTRMDYLDAFWTLPQNPRHGQVVTSSHGQAYMFDDVMGEWIQGPSTTVSQPYIFNIGLTEAPPLTVNLDPATATGEIGGINEPTADGLWLRSAAGAVYSWAAAAAGTAYIWGLGLTEAPPGTINLDPATPTVIGGMTEPASDGNWMRNAAGAVYSWVPAAAGALTFDTGLTLTGTSVNLDPALPPGGEIGGINEPPADTGLQYTRSYTGGVGAWTQMSPASLTAGIGIDFVPPGGINIDLLPATPTVIGGVSVVARSLTQGLDLVASGALTAPLATALLAGSIVEPAADGNYVRNALAGVFTWQLATAATFLWGIGLTEDTTTTPVTINLDPAQFAPGEIGGITSEARSLTQGLLLDPATGHLTTPLATDLLAGAIVEPLPDGLTYGRTRTTAGVSSWVPVSAVTVADAAPTVPPPTQGALWFDSDSGKFYVYFVDANSAQWVQIGGV